MIRKLVPEKLNEAIISPDENEFLKDFIQQLPEYLYDNPRYNILDLNDWASQFDIEIVNYDTFFEELPDDQKESAPPKGDPRAPFFALFNPVTLKPRVVLQQRLHPRDVDYLRHMLSHESIHAEQYARKTGGVIPLPDPKKPKEYFSNTDEIMAFSHSIADMEKQRMRMERLSTEQIMKTLHRNPMYSEIKNSVDIKTLQKYNKYIYLYLKSTEE